jgi:ribonuclease-3
MEAKRLTLRFIQQIRLLTVSQKEPYLLFREMLGFYPGQLSLYEQALRHRSLGVRAQEGTKGNNERLEFLGDAVLNTLIADILFQQFPDQNEDFLTKTRSKIVQRSSLNRIAIELGLDKLTRTSGNPAKSSSHSIYGNALEALIGAIYLDQGYRRCKQFVEQRILLRFVDLEEVAHTEHNFKSALLEWSQHEKRVLTFETTECPSPGARDSQFQAKAVISGLTLGEGTGASKKEAQQKAAKEALEAIHSKGVHLPTPSEAL